MHGDGALFIDPLTSLAARAGFGHNLTGALALSAWAANAEKTLLEAKLSRSLAARTGLNGRGGFGAGSLAVAARLPSRDFQFGFFPVDGFLKGQFQVVLKVVAALGAPTASALAEEVFKDIVEHITEACTARAAETFKAGSLLRPGMPEDVVTFPFFLIAQNFVRFIDLFELFFGGFLLVLAGLQVRVVLPRHPPVSLLELVVGDGFLDAENIVVIAFGHGWYRSGVSTERPSSHPSGNSVCLLRIVGYFFSLSTSSNSASTTFSSVFVSPAPLALACSPEAPVVDAAFLYISSASLWEADIRVCVADSMASASVPSRAVFRAATAS